MSCSIWKADKALFEYESPESGYVRKLVARNGDVVPVLSVIALITDEADEAIEHAEATEQGRERRIGNNSHTPRTRNPGGKPLISVSSGRLLRGGAPASSILTSPLSRARGRVGASC